MKTLYLIRHAKSSWAFDLNDHDRPLGKRGRKDVFKMGEHLASKQPPPEVLISSTASRAFYTALFLCDQMGIDEGKVQLEKSLYHAGANEILAIMKRASNCERLAIFGHNPGFTSAANAMANLAFDNIPTCGIVGINFDVKYWSEVAFGKGMLSFFYFPKEI